MNYKALSITLFIILILNLIITYRIWVLYEPQATIVLHDYGRVFENEIDWKIWRLEHNK